MNDTKYKITNGITMQVEDVMCGPLHIRMRDMTQQEEKEIDETVESILASLKRKNPVN